MEPNHLRLQLHRHPLPFRLRQFESLPFLNVSNTDVMKVAKPAAVSAPAVASIASSARRRLIHRLSQLLRKWRRLSLVVLAFTQRQHDIAIGALFEMALLPTLSCGFQPRWP